jgi:hypothetical protein
MARCCHKNTKLKPPLGIFHFFSKYLPIGPLILGIFGRFLEKWMICDDVLQISSVSGSKLDRGCPDHGGGIPMEIVG